MQISEEFDWMTLRKQKRKKQKIRERTLANVIVVKVLSLWSFATSTLWATWRRKSIWTFGLEHTQYVGVVGCVCVCVRLCGHEAKWWCPLPPPTPQLAPSWPSQMLISHVEFLSQSNKYTFLTFNLFFLWSMGDNYNYTLKWCSHFRAFCFFQIFL